MSEVRTDFIVIDDDPVNNRICSIIIERTFPGRKALCFTEPEEALDFISENYKDTSERQAVLLLDINMPVLNGWDVLERIEHFPGHVRDNIAIHILSSSVDVYDKRRAGENVLVRGYIEKPLTIEHVRNLVR